MQCDITIKYGKRCLSQRPLYHNNTKIEGKFRKQCLITQQESHISQIFVLSTMQFYPKVLLIFTHAIVGKRWVKRFTRPTLALCELALAIPRCRTDPFSRSFLPAVRRNLLPSRLFSGDNLNSIKSAMNLCLQRA